MKEERDPGTSAGRPKACRQPVVATITIYAPLARSDLPGLFDRTCSLLDAGPTELLRCKVGGVEADAVAVDALARLALAARRRGCRVHLWEASAKLLDLVELVGLADVIGAASLPVEPGRQPEQREDGPGAQEEGELGDPPVRHL